MTEQLNNNNQDLMRSLSQLLSYLEVEDPRIVLLEALVQGDDSCQDFFIQSEGGNGGQQPAVTCEYSTRNSHQRGLSHRLWCWKSKANLAQMFQLVLM